MKTRLWCIAIPAIVVLLTVTTGAVADPAVERNQADQRLAEAEAALEGATEAAREAGLTLTELTEALPDAKDRVSDAKGAVAAAKVVADGAVAAATEAREAHRAAEDRYTEAADTVDTARDELDDLATLSYQRGPFVTLKAMLHANGPIDAARRAGWVELIARDRTGVVDEVVRLRQDARNAENDAEVASDDAVAAETAATDALGRAQAELDEAQTAESALETLVAEQRDARDAADDERDATLRQYRDAQAFSDSIADTLSTVGSGSSGGAELLRMPVAGWKSSDFGNRYDPVYHVWQLHAGTDFAADGGAPIHAAAAGEVVQAGWNGGYGNYTCIHHHDDVATCYAHQSRIAVTVGQRVTAGEYIGDVGTTGASTGTHLHFEVRVDGEPVQPLEWLPACLC